MAMFENQVRVKLSVIVPITGTAKKVRQSIDSVLCQTLQETELICVDCGVSPENTAVLADAVKKDGRIKVVHGTLSADPYQAVLEGVQNVTGKYFMLLNAGDRLQPNAGSTVWNRLEKDQTDILQFNTRLDKQQSERTPDEAEGLDNINQAGAESILRGRLALLCLKENQFSHTVWNKVYRTAVYKAEKMLQVQKGEEKLTEKLLLFMLLFDAKSIKFCRQELLWHSMDPQRIDDSVCDYASFASFCREKVAYQMAERFLQLADVENDYWEWLDEQKQATLNRLLRIWLDQVGTGDAVQTWRCLVENWGVQSVMEALTENFWDEISRILERLSGSGEKLYPEKTVKNVAVFYYRLTNGGIERVTSTVLPFWQKKGYHITLITECEPSDQDYSVNCELNRVILPKEEVSLGGNYAARAKAWQQLIEAYGIDTVVHEAHVSQLLPWDVICLKSLGINVVVWSHGLFSFSYRFCEKSYIDACSSYRLVDRIVVLSPIFALYWSAFAPTVYIPNPCCIQPEHPEEKQKNNILWVGRIGPEKHLREALKAFAEVAAVIQDATMTVVGKCDDPGQWEKLQRLVKKLKIADKVQFAGYQTQVTEYYKNATVFWMTSEFEGYALVLAEAKSKGLPIVMFDLPYLAQVLDNRGVTSVPQQDVSALAGETVALLTDRKALRQQAMLSYQAALDESRYDYAAAWDTLFASFGGSIPAEWSIDKNHKMMIDQMMKDINYGIITTFADYQTQVRRCREYEETLNEIKKSSIYKMGRFVTVIPRRIKGFFQKKEHFSQEQDEEE